MYDFLQNLVRGESPQQREIQKISHKYIDCEAHLAFILPANFIKKPILNKKQNKHSTGQVLSNLFCGIRERVRPQKYSNRHSFTEASVTDSASEYSTSSATNKRSLTPELVNNYNNGKMNASNKFPSSISSPNLAKQDSGSSTSSSNRFGNLNLINLSDDYGQIMAERERRVEERRMSGSRGTQTSSSGSSVNGDINRTPKSKKKALLLQPAPNREIKPSTILRLDDRDLIVIDKQDIKESVRNESDVIIVDPPAIPQTPSESEQAELCELLVGNWPDQAGATGTLLSSDKKGNSFVSTGNGYRTIERNRSANLASHFSNQKARRNDGYESQNGYQQRKSK